LTQENPPKNFDPPILMNQQCIVVKFWLKKQTFILLQRNRSLPSQSSV